MVIELDLRDRKSLIASLPKDGVVAEIGVAEGLFSDFIWETCQPAFMVLVDCWEHQSDEVFGHDPSNHPQHVHDANYNSVIHRFAGKPVEVMRGYSIDIVQRFPDGFFDWIFIDANHLQARQDAEAWWPKIKHGGWLLGHDYTIAGDFITVKRDIDAWANDNGLRLQIAGLNSEDVFERNYPSYAIYKQ